MRTTPHFIKNTDFYAAAARNQRNTKLLFALLLLILATSGYLIGWAHEAQYAADIWFFSSWGVLGALAALAVGAVWIVIAITQGSRIIMQINGARELRPGEAPQLENVVQEIAIAAGIPPPRIFMIETESMNAFATGMSIDKACVGITRGLLDQLTRDELQAVIAHEIGHIVNVDIRYATAVGIVVGLVTLISEVMRRMLFWGGLGGGAGRRRSNGKGGGHGLLLLLMIVFSVLAALAAVLVQMAISREREYLADATSVRLTRNPMSMISALEKLSTRNTPMEHANKAVQHLYIVNPFKQFTARSSALFSTHPSLEQRIARIKDLR